MMTTRETQTLTPLPDGRLLIGTRAGERDRILVMQAGKPPSTLVDGNEDTRPPATAVGPEHAAVMMGPRSSPDMAIINTADGRLVRRFKAPTPTMVTLAASPDGRTRMAYRLASATGSIPRSGASLRGSNEIANH